MTATRFLNVAMLITSTFTIKLNRWVFFLSFILDLQSDRHMRNASFFGEVTSFTWEFPSQCVTPCSWIDLASSML